MNFLAHLWLADRLHADLVGAVLGDVVRGRLQGRYPPALERSIALHRRIDALTDAHPRVSQARTAFPPGARRYAGIILDVLYDHALALDWPRYSHESLSAFAARSGAALESGGDWFEASGVPRPSASRFADMLCGYRTADGVALTLERIGRRLRPTPGWHAAVAAWPLQIPEARAAAPSVLADVLSALRAAT